jgi:hypothetical protein
VTQTLLRSELTGPLSALGAPARTSAAGTRARRDALALAGDEALIAPAATYRIIPVAAVCGATVDLGGTTLRAPALTAERGDLKALAAAVCTLGPAIEQRISQLFAARRRSLALALDSLANEMLFRLADRTVAAIAREARDSRWKTGVEISPGDPGMPLEQQPAVLALAGAAGIGVALAGAASLSPSKSVSMVVALGRGLQARTRAQRCDACPSRTRCRGK